MLLILSVTSECWESFDYVGAEEEGECASNTEDFTKFKRTNSYPKENISRVKYTHHDEITRVKRPMWISPNIEVKIADLGNGCWEVSLILIKLNTS